MTKKTQPKTKNKTKQKPTDTHSPKRLLVELSNLESALSFPSMMLVRSPTALYNKGDLLLPLSYSLEDWTEKYFWYVVLWLFFPCWFFSLSRFVFRFLFLWTFLTFKVVSDTLWRHILIMWLHWVFGGKYVAVY